MKLSIIPQWNNSEGGPDLDTTRCFIGRARFETLQAQISPQDTILGLDEHTALILDLAAERCQVIGRSEVHILCGSQEKTFPSGESFPITELGPFQPLADPWQDIPPAISSRFQQQTESKAEIVPSEVQLLVEARQSARQNREWAEADRLRLAIQSLGWSVKDTPLGPQSEKLK